MLISSPPVQVQRVLFNRLAIGLWRLGSWPGSSHCRKYCGEQGNAESRLPAGGDRHPELTSYDRKEDAGRTAEAGCCYENEHKKPRGQLKVKVGGLIPLVKNSGRDIAPFAWSIFFRKLVGSFSVSSKYTYIFLKAKLPSFTTLESLSQGPGSHL